MNCSRRQFLRVALTGMAAVPVLGNQAASGLALHPTGFATTDALLDEIEHRAFNFFWNETHPDTGLVFDRTHADGGGRSAKASIAATGFGLTALCIGHERAYRAPIQIEERIARTLSFIAREAQTEHGFLYHFVEPGTGRRYLRSEISPIDMAILLCGVLTCREYFQSRQIRDAASEIYNRIEWPWMLSDGRYFALDWKPEHGFSHLRWDAYCESMMLYLLALGSTSHPIPADCWHAIRRPAMVYGDYKYISIPAPLFVHQFSHAWFDFRDKHDEHANYFLNSVRASHAHREFCIELGKKFPSYSKDLWGITASVSSAGYVAWGGPPLVGPIDGTIVPAASAGSLPFIFPEALAVSRNLKALYENRIWKRYGFVDAFNPLTGWSSSDVLGIDLGITMLMAENARTEFVWNHFMNNPEVAVAMDRAGFLPDGFEVPQLA